MWQLPQALYGRRTAGSNFRDFWEALICALPDVAMVRGKLEPCAYRSTTTDLVVIHHVDDGRLCGNQEALNTAMTCLARF